MRKIESYFFNDLNDVFILKAVIFADFLWIELNGATPNHCIPEILDHISMNSTTKAFNFGEFPGQDNGRIIIGISSFGLSINPNQIQIFPHPINKLIKIPSQITSNGHIMFNLIKNSKFIQCKSINLIQSIQTRNILSITFNNINNIILSSITLYTNVTVVHFVLF